MRRYLVRRLLWFAATLWAVVTAAFLLMRAAPGGPFDGERALDAVVERNLAARYHLDWPLWKQYLQYLGPLDLDPERGARLAGGDGTRTFGGLLALDFGPSLKYRDFSVSDVLAQSLPVSLGLGAFALAWSLAAGVAVGVLSAVRRGTALDAALRVLATAGAALPSFVVALLLVAAFALGLRALPVAGWGGAEHLVLPGLALGAPVAAHAARLARAGMLEVLSQDHVRTARAKGMPPRIVLLRHALPGALLPVLSYAGPAAAGVLTGSLVIEKVFAVPGTGTHFVNSALNRDYTLAMGVTVVYTVLVYGFNTLVDVAYGLLDPRIGGEAAGRRA